jgi:hypothetical protein
LAAEGVFNYPLLKINAIVPVGVEAPFDAHSKFGKAPHTCEWKFSDGITLNGENITRSLILQADTSLAKQLPMEMAIR